MNVANAYSKKVEVCVACGAGSHEIELLIMPWGDVVLEFNPCEYLPLAVRKLASANCQESITELLQKIRRELQLMLVPRRFHEFGSDRYSKSIIVKFIEHTHKCAPAIARSVLRNASLNEGCMPSDAIDWAAIVTAEVADGSLGKLILRADELSTFNQLALLAHQHVHISLGTSALPLAKKLLQNHAVHPVLAQKLCSFIGKYASPDEIRDLVAAVHGLPAIQKQAIDELRNVLARACRSSDRNLALQFILRLLDEVHDRPYSLSQALASAEFLDDVLDRLVAMLPALTDRRKIAAFQLLAGRNVDAYEIYLDQISESSSTRLREVACIAIQGCKRALTKDKLRATRFAVRILDHGPQTLRLFALDLLTAISHPAAVGALLSRADSSNKNNSSSMQMAAMECLARVGGASTLWMLLKDHREPIAETYEIWIDTLVTLAGKLRNTPASVHLLDRLLYLSNEAVALAAVEKLEAIGHSACNLTLLRAAHSRFESVAIQSLFALRNYNSTDTWQQLLIMCQQTPSARVSHAIETCKYLLLQHFQELDETTLELAMLSGVPELVRLAIQIMYDSQEFSLANSVLRRVCSQADPQARLLISRSVDELDSGIREFAQKLTIGIQ